MKLLKVLIVKVSEFNNPSGLEKTGKTGSSLPGNFVI